MSLRFTILWLGVIFALSCKSCADHEPDPLEMGELTVSQIHQAYASGQLTAESLMQYYLERIATWDQQINSITFINPLALEQARALDREFEESGKLRPLHGIPMLVKDNYHTKGMPTTGGSMALSDFIPENDAFQIRRLLEAGAIIIGKTNMAEWAFSPKHTNSATAGTTKNPYNLLHVPAGSSGGTAAAVASNFATIGLGTDTGNSIRGPSSHNALVGFRSTLGLTSRDGIIPLYLRNDVGGPMCRSVEDATRILEAIAGYDSNDPITKHSKGVDTKYLKYLNADALVTARIGVLRVLSADNPHAEVDGLFQQALNDMSRAGATIIDPLEVPGFDSLRQNQWCSEFRQDIEDHLQKYLAKENLSTLEELIAAGTPTPYALNGMEHFLDHSGRAQGDISCGNPYNDPLRIAFRKAIEQAMDQAQVDVLVYPSWNHPAALLDKFEEEYLGDNSQVIAPHTGQPAFTVPMGYTQNGLPAGLQLLGRMFAEPTLIGVAYAYEQLTNHRVPPPGFGLNTTSDEP